MALTFVQSDTVAPCGTIQACSPNATANTPQARLAVRGGAAGSSPLTVTVRNQQSAVMFELSPVQVTWAAGTWTIPLNITTGNATPVIKAVYVCRRSSACAAVSTVGSTTGLSVATTAGVKSLNVTGSASSGASSDKAYIVIVVDGSASPTQFGFTPDQTITTPIVAAEDDDGRDFPYLNLNVGYLGVCRV